MYICYGGDTLHCVGQITSETQPLDAATKALVNNEEGWIYRTITPLFFPKTSVIYKGFHVGIIGLYPYIIKKHGNVAGII